MEEKILIKGSFNKKNYKTLRNLACIFLPIAIVLFAILMLPHHQGGTYSYCSFGNHSWCHNYFGGSLVYALEYGFTIWLVIFIVAILSLLIGVPTSIICFAAKKCELYITDKNVKGKTYFGKEVVLPIYMVSSYSVRSFLSTIVIATSSGLTKFAFVENYAEIGNVLSTMINARQDNTATVSPAPKDSLDELVKLKSLLDAGIITQEEFNAKKKQLLGL